MGVLDETRFIETPRFFNGQRLFADDLQTVDSFNQEMRWLHNRSLHQPGIGSGFAVYGSKGDRHVTVGPGYAIDSFGREIVSTQTETLEVPPVSSEDDGQAVIYDLTVSYPDDTELEEAETRAGICQARGVTRLREKPTFCWVRLKRDELGNLTAQDPNIRKQIESSLKIVLARAEVLNCQLNQDLSIAQRRSARPATQPYITCRNVQPAPWSDLQVGTTVIGLKADIDTTSAGFLTTPCYMARLEGPRITTVTRQNQEVSVLINSLMSIQNASPEGFTILVEVFAQPIGAEGRLFSLRAGSLLVLGLLKAESPAVEGEPAATNPNDEIRTFVRDNWGLVWMGVEG